MRVELAVATTLLLPSIVGGKLTTTASAAASSSDHVISAGLPQQQHQGCRNNNPPLWKSRQHALIQRVLTTAKSSHEPDVGILSQPSMQRSLQQQQTNNNSSGIIDLCQVVGSVDETTCDCSNWNVIKGSFTCDLYNGDEYCFDDDDGVCMTASFGVTSDGTNVGIDYCVDTTKPEFHSYCTTYQMSQDGFVNSKGDFVGAAGNCTMTVDAKQCKSCMIQTDCTTDSSSADGRRQLPGPGPFDCTNTAAQSSGNQCLGDLPFPIFSNDSSKDDEGNSLNGDAPAASPTGSDVTPSAANDNSGSWREAAGLGSVVVTCLLAVTLAW